jgi:hypothetical protein
MALATSRQTRPDRAVSVHKTAQEVWCEAARLNAPAKPSGEGSSKASTSKGVSPFKVFQLLQPTPNIHVEAKPRQIDPTRHRSKPNHAFEI